MRGVKEIHIYNSRVHYKLFLERNITIIRGDSGTGKTSMLNIIEDFLEDGESSGAHINYDNCVILTNSNFKYISKELDGYIIFADEQSSIIYTEEFAAFVKNSSNYFVLITRDPLYHLAYSVDSVYEMRMSGKYPRSNKFYNEVSKFYNSTLPLVLPDILVIEDSGFGYEFFKNITDKHNIRCISSNGNTGMHTMLNTLIHNEERLLVIADGSAFGSFMDRIYRLMQYFPNKIHLYLPESFEFLILNSDVVNDCFNDMGWVKDMIYKPYDYIDYCKFNTWEQYYTYLLSNVTKSNKIKRYSKSHLTKYYASPIIQNKILIANQLDFLVSLRKDVAKMNLF